MPRDTSSNDNSWMFRLSFDTDTTWGSSDQNNVPEEREDQQMPNLASVEGWIDRTDWAQEPSAPFTGEAGCMICGFPYGCTIDGFTGEEYNLCRSCYKIFHVACEFCGHDFFKFEVDWPENFCPTCKESMIECDTCGSLFHEEGNESIARLCRCHRCLRDSRIQSHNYRADIRRIMGENNKALTIGIELEIDGGYTSEMIDFIEEIDGSERIFWVVHDGSLTPAGLEIVSQPASLDIHQERIPWRQVLTRARELRFDQNDRAGLHVHLGREFLGPIGAVKLGAFLYSNLYMVSRFARRSNCARYAREKRLSEHISQFSTPQRIRVRGRSQSRSEFNAVIGSGRQPEGQPPPDHPRYEAVNYTNASTVELRMFKGTINPEIFFATLQFCQLCSEFVQRRGITSVMRGSSWYEFIEEAKKSKHEELKNYIDRKGLYK